MTTIFNRLSKSRPAEAKIEPPYENHPQLLLDWLLQHWTNPNICLRDIRAYAPNSIRDEEIAISSAETLARHGWLTELNAHRHDRRVWRIDRKPIIHPIVPTE